MDALIIVPAVAAGGCADRQQAGGNEVFREYTENSLSELSDIRGYASALTQTMDYYACDTRSNTSITNSSQPALKEIADGTTPEENPYVYYVRISYDGAGNVAGCSVSADVKSVVFLKRVEAMGR